MSIYRQLWLAIIVSTLLALFGSLLASTLNARAYLSEQLTSKNVDNAAALALALSQQHPDPVMIELTVASLFDSGHYDLIRVTDPAGKVMIERVAPKGQYTVPSWFVELLPLYSAPGQAQISSGWTQLGTLTLVSSTQFAYQSLWRSILEMIGALALSGVVGGYLGTRILRKMRQPLQRVIDQAQAVSNRHFISIEEPAIPELRQLAVAMNGMVARLKSMFAEEAGRLETMRLRANCDALTGLANQAFFLVQLLESLENEEKVGGTLLLIRIDDLAAIQQRLGREATEELLKGFAQVLGEHAKRAEALAARLNDADFALLLPSGVDPVEGSEQLLATLELTDLGDQHENPKVAVGMARLQRGQDIAGLLAEASIALAAAEASDYSAIREAQAGNVPPSPTIRQWAELFEDALSQKRTRLAPLPVLNMQGALVHNECLLELQLSEQDEWQQVTRLSHVVEQLHLASRLDFTAITLGLEQLKAAPQLAGLSLCISMSSLLDGNFRRQFQTLLNRYAGVSRRLSVQVPEAEAVKHLTAFREFCIDLKKTGCGIGLQHVGRQLGDIGQLHDLGLDFLKVDASFVRGLQYSAGNQAFLRGLSSIAHHIGTRVYAEGVVDRIELAELAALDFDGASGSAVKPGNATT